MQSPKIQNNHLVHKSTSPRCDILFVHKVKWQGPFSSIYITENCVPAYTTRMKIILRICHLNLNQINQGIAKLLQYLLIYRVIPGSRLSG